MKFYNPSMHPFFQRANENENSSQNTEILCSENCLGIPWFTSKFLISTFLILISVKSWVEIKNWSS